MIGLYGPGMHEYILLEAELGPRVAAYQDEEDCMGINWILFFAYDKGPGHELHDC